MDTKTLLVFVIVIAVIIAVLLSVLDFSGQLSARQHVLDFVRYIQADSIPDLDSYLMLDSVAANLYRGSEFDTISQSEILERCRDDFQRQGRYRMMFIKSQVVVNQEQLLDDTTATVEVSYIDRQTRIQYYTQMLLRRATDGWLICRLRLEQ